jgi:two-component system, response regulator PdtaR
MGSLLLWLPTAPGSAQRGIYGCWPKRVSVGVLLDPGYSRHRFTTLRFARNYKQRPVSIQRWRHMSNVPRVPRRAHLPSVLVVEDDFLVRAVAVAHLQDCGFSIMEAQTADEAMAILRNDRSIAAVFSDVQMPGRMDGIALAQWLARTCPSVKVLLTSGRMVPDKSRGWRFLAKPYTLEQMERELRNLLVARPEG